MSMSNGKGTRDKGQGIRDKERGMGNEEEDFLVMKVVPTVQSLGSLN